MRDHTTTIQSITDDILAEVEASEQAEKTAAERGPEMKTDQGKTLVKLASEMREMAKSGVEDLSYDDLRAFLESRF
jgi:hypothetical protein